ncbi:hypothetical protein GP486_001063 [Trichoglossum hirsutum]|uniref:Pentatricopeptide repeat protein n=1 Tax=Trichoglossum hirsutum TaxID=265104 RepID=A0A9P8RSY9_9PEZI|nr:hypothetical protein GP486_001063 [Trichoglossum hirsutum]
MLPSKGVLRLLRHIAYASSAGAVLVVEARRRQICVVEELHDNAKKIRSSRKYHSSAAANGIELLSLPEDDASKVVELRWSEEPAITQMPHLPRQRRRTNVKGKDSRDTQLLTPESGLPPAMPTRLTPFGRVQSRTSPVVRAYEQVSTSIIASQDAVIYQIDKLLAMGDIKGAVGKFFACFRHSECVNAAISDTARRLSVACKEANSPILADKVHRKLAEAGLIFQLRGGNSRLEEDIEKLLAESRVEGAVAMFMARTRRKDILIGEKAMKAIDSLSLATLHAKQWRLTNAIFWRLYSMGHRDSNAWTKLLQGYGESKQYEAVIDLYKRLLGHFELNHIALAVVLRALIAQLQLSEAETLLKSALKPPWLPLRSCFTILLGGIWRVTKDLSRTIELFEWMETWFCRYRPSAALFNAMIQACIEAGRTDSAEFYVQLMKKYDLQPNVKTHAHFLLAKAKSGDWRGVDTGLRKIHEDKLELTQTNASAFNPLLIESSRTRSLSDTESFLLSAIENYGIVPDLKTFNIMSSAFVRAGELTSLARLVEYMKAFGLQPDATTFNTAFHQLWRDTKVHHMELYRVCSEIQRSDRALVNERTKNTIRHAMAHDYRKGFSPVAHYSKIKTFIGRRSNDLQQQDARSVHLNMVVALSQNIASSRKDVKRKMADNVLQIYNTAKASGMQISREMVETAFQACLQKGDFELGMELVRSAREDGIDCASLLPLVFSSMPNEVKHLRGFLLQMYRQRDDHGLEIKHHASVTAAFLLVESRRSHAAVDILTRVMQSEWGKRKPLDIVGMSVLMKAYVGLKDAEGIKRVVDIVLSRRMRIDTPFIRLLKGAVPLLENTNKGEVMEQPKRVTKPASSWVRDCIALKKEQMKESQKKGEVILNIFTDRLGDVTKSAA